MSGETEEKPSGWTTDTALEYMRQQHNDLRSHLEQEIALALRALDERYATQTKALDAAFLAQQTAMQTAFTAADRAVQAALESAEKAVTKAEIAAEKRFEAVNEFRGQLADQAATLMARSEAEVRFISMTDKLAAEVTWTSERFVIVNQRLDLTQGQTDGGDADRAKVFGYIGATGGIVGILLGIIALIAVFRV